MNKQELVKEIKSAVSNASNDIEISVCINGVDFNMVGYDNSDDTAFVFSTEHDIECVIDDTLKEGDLLNILSMVN